MSTRIPGLLTATAAISVALTGVAAASGPQTAPPPAPPAPNLDTNPAYDINPAYGLNPSSDGSSENAAPRPRSADPKPRADEAEAPEAEAPKSPPKHKSKHKPKGKPEPKSEAEDGTDLEACEDAQCQVEVKDGQTITFDKKYGMAPLHIKIEGRRLTFTARGRQGTLTASLDTDGPSSGTYNGITLRPHRGKDGSVILDISHA
ncbi:hypothetical protein AB0C21_19620 [Spirillospora sp. NPDC049024]